MRVLAHNYGLPSFKAPLQMKDDDLVNALSILVMHLPI